MIQPVNEGLPAVSSASVAALPSEALDKPASVTNGASAFEDVFMGTVAGANQADHVATEKMEALASGASDDLHGTMIAVKEADISIKLVATIRNKLLDAFTEIWKTSV